MTGVIDGAAEALLDLALQLGATACDIVAVSGEAVSVEVLDGRIETLERSEAVDLGLRVLCGQSQAIVSASRVTADALPALAERAVAMARAAPPDPLAGLAPAELLAGDIADLALADEAAPDADTLAGLARTAEAAGRAVPGVTRTNGCSASASRRRILYLTSTGFRGAYERTGYSVAATMVAGSGTAMERDYDYHSVTRFADLEAAEAIGRRAGERAARRLNPRKIKSGRVTVVFEQRLAGSLAGHLAGAISGSAVARGTSFLKDRLGERVFAPGIGVIDDATRRHGLASRPFDGEGVASRPLAVVEDGVLKSWLTDCRSARQLGTASTGHASRGTGSPPAPASTNFHIAAGAAAPEALLAAEPACLLVCELIGMGVNPVTGDYSRGASGFWVENGAVAYPVSEITVAGNLVEMFANLTPACDLAFRAATNAPTCRIEGMTVAGT